LQEEAFDTHKLFGVMQLQDPCPRISLHLGCIRFRVKYRQKYHQKFESRGGFSIRSVVSKNNTDDTLEAGA
jgi:hypothetical protein